MKKISKILSLVLAACMIFAMLPALSASAADDAPGGFMEITSGSNRYLSTVGSNAFNVFMYDNTFSGTFGDQHMGGIEFSLNGMRIATNGDLHLLPTPEQWDATPAPSRGTKAYDTATNTITVPMTFSGATDGSLKYDLIASPTAKGMKLQMILRTDMPESLQGKARFNLELLPSSYKNKSFQADLNGDGVYDSFGVFPLHPQDAMVDTERADLPSQAWYVKEWNEERGDDQPTPFASAYGYSFAPEDGTTGAAFTIAANTDDKIELLDGRNRAQNGWYVMSTVISATKAGDTAVEWIVEPSVDENWVREPNVGFSQVGYSPAQEKFAVVELDKYDEDYPKTMSLWRVNADGSEENVCEKELGDTTSWMRFKYARFDFTEITEAGLYRIHYGDYVGDIFPISKEAYDRVWHTTLSGFLAVQMDHIAVRDGYKIWHGASHMDDGCVGDRSVSWFDGMSMRNLPDAIRNKGYKGEDHVDGLNKGGWFDAGDFDLQISRNVQVLGYLVDAGEICGRADGYDDLSVTWDDATGGLVEMHRPDGIPDVVQQCIHGSKQLLAEYECLGGTGGCMEVRTLRQYTHLGDPSSDTDGYIYDATLSAGEVVERDGKVYSGVPDDRYFLTAGGGGSFSAGLSQNICNQFAGTAYMAVAYPETQDYAQHLFNVCIDRWKNSSWTTNWDSVVQFTLASDAFEKAGVAYDDMETYSAAYFKELLDALLTDSNLNAGSHINVLALKHLLTDEQWAKVEASVENQNVSVNTQPYGVNFTSGASWGASPNTYSGVRNISFMYYHFPLKKFEQNILRSVDYLMGRHPATNKSWISGVGTQSAMHPYNSNRAEESYIPGSILPGHITFSDYVESMDDFSYLWFEGESIINYQSSWLPVGIAAGHIAHNEDEPAVAETKDFESSFDAELVEKASTSMWGGGSSNYYFADDGFNMIMYATDFDRTFGDQHCAGIELIQDGRRIATNGDIHLLPTPEQWDATPAPTKGTITAEGDIVTVPMTIPAETFDNGDVNPAVNYQLIAEPEQGGIKLTVKLDEALPADLVGKAGFNLEFLPAVFIGKSYQSDTDGDGTYDQFGVFPQDPRDEMVEMERARTNNQAWYVQEWNEDRGDYQPVPFATGKKMTFAAESDDYRIRISSEDGLALYDGRNRAQNGWFVLRTLIPEGATEIVWHISPDTNAGWVREPNITHSQVGYEPELDKVAVIELDANYSGSEQAKLLKLESDGSYTEVFSAALGEAKTWQRYVYRDFDFSEVTARGMYVIEYDGVKSDPFPIDKGVYSKIWTESIGNYMAVQMDHMRIREGYKIWRNAAHMDDALQAPVSTSYFDGQAMGANTDSKYEAYEHIPYLDQGGFSDAGDFDIQVAQNLGVINSLTMAYQVFGEDYDTLDCNWDTHNVELHRSDGTADLVELAKHGALNIYGQIKANGYTASVIEVPSLRQYTHLGDGSKDTDNRIYDATLAEDEVYGLHSGLRDDRLAFFGTKSASSQLNAAQALAGAASIMDDSDPDKAAFIETAEALWNENPSSHEGVETTVTYGQWTMTSGPADWNAAIQLFAATGKDVYKDRILQCFDYEMNTEGGGGFFGGGGGFGSSGWRAVVVLDKLGDEAKAKFEAALAAYAPTMGQPNASNPYGVSDTMGMWGGSGGVVSGATTAAVLHKYYPDVVDDACVFRAINYILGTHPYNSTSWISGVGTKSVTKGYGSNRADFYYIAGGLAPGYVTIAPDFPEHMDDFNFLWFENEYTVEVTANWILLTLGADDFAREDDKPCEHDWQIKVTEPTCTKGGYSTYFCNNCFESYVGDYTDALGHDFDDGVVTREPSAMFDGVKTFTCRRCGESYTEPIPKTGGAMEKAPIDFKDPADKEKYEIVGQTQSDVEEGVGLTLICTRKSIEPAKRPNTGDYLGPEDVVEIPVREGNWVATLKFDFDPAGGGSSYAFFGFFASQGDDYQNMLGIRGGDSTMQNFERHDGTVTHEDEEGVSSAPGFSTAGTFWYQIGKVGDSYICLRSDDGVTFEEMFSYDASGIEATKLIIDAYSASSRGNGRKYILDSLTIEYPVEAPGWVEAKSVEPGESYVIVADGAYALNGQTVSLNGTNTLGATPVVFEDGKLITEVTEDMLWTFDEGTGTSPDGNDLYAITNSEGSSLLRTSGRTPVLSLGSYSTNYGAWSLIERAPKTRAAEGTDYTLYVNGSSSSVYAMNGSEDGFNCTYVSRNGWDSQNTGSAIRLYEYDDGTPKLDKKAIRQAIKAANAVTRRYYTDETLAALDEALAAAEAALENAEDQAALDAAAEALNAAVEGLQRRDDLEKFNVTFDFNYTGAPEPVVVQVEDGLTVEPIEAPARTGYAFNYWGRQSSSQWGGSSISQYDFSTPITADLTLKASWSKDWSQMYSLAEEYADYFPFGNFGTMAPSTTSVNQVTREYNTYSGNSGKMTYNFGANESKNAYNEAVAAINADETLTEEEKAEKIKEADGKVLLGSSNPLASSLNSIRTWNEAHPEGPKKWYRQHVLFWHGSEQNAAFYHEGFDTSKPLVSKEVMNARIDSYVEAMFKRYQEWDDVILSWDVVNEALDDYNGMVRNGWNGSSWGETSLDDASNQSSAWGTIYRMKDAEGNPVTELSEERLQYESEWIREAFKAARKWQQELGVHWTLYYNDYMNSSMLYEPKMTNTLKMLKPISEAGNLDGYGMQARLATAYPTIDLLRYQIEEGLKLADEVSFSEGDVRTDFEVNPLFDPEKPTRRVQQGDEEWDEGGSGSYSRRSQQNGNTYDVSNGPVRRKANFNANDPETMRIQADYYADLMDIMLEKADLGKVGAVAIDGTSDSNTFNRSTGCQIWDSSNNEKPAFYALIGCPNRHKMGKAIEAGPALSEEAEYTAETWAPYAAALEAAEALVDVRIYDADGVEAVKKATADLLAATEALEKNGQPAGEYKLTTEIIPGANYIIVADDAYALTGNAAAGTVGSKAVTVGDDKITGEVSSDMIWVFDETEGVDAAADGNDLFFLSGDQGKFLRRSSSALQFTDFDEANARYFAWSVIEREENTGVYTFYSNSSSLSSRYAVTIGENGATAARVSSSSGNILASGSPVKLYTDGQVCEHEWVTEVVEPTCLEGGYTRMTCSKCGKEKITDKVAALGHDWVDGEILVAPTATEFGKQELICSRCGEKTTKTLLPTELTEGPTIVADPDSPTGYIGRFVYKNENATSVTFAGDIALRNDADRSDNTVYTPFEYRPGLMRAGSFTAPMENLGGGYWYYEVPLACGANQYWFYVNGNTNTMVPDPANTPIWSPTATQKNGYNYVYVPYDEKQDYAPLKAREAENPRTDGKVGTWSYVPIEISGTTHHMGVYLPYGYDAERAEPYKLIFVLHGYGQDESDWMNIGSVQKIMDNLAAEGRTEPALIVSVTTNNNEIGGQGDNYSNLMNVILPFLEEKYNISDDPMNRAFCGLSMGSMNTQNIINGGADRFGYFGPFSGGMRVNATAPGLEKTHIFFGTGWSDTTVAPTPTAHIPLQEAGFFVEYREVTGGHDFNAWCQLFRIFCEEYAWNPAAFGDVSESAYKLTDEIIPGANYIIVADDAYALSGNAAEGTTAAKAVTIADGKVTGEITEDMIWVFEDAEGIDPASDGADQYFITNAGSYLRRVSGGSTPSLAEFSTANARYFPWSVTDREEDTGFTLYQNGSSRYAVTGAETGFTVARVSSSSGNIHTAGSSIRLYTDAVICEHEWVSEVVAPTCTEGGYTKLTCTKCGRVKITDRVPAAGHVFDEESTVVVEPTCTEGGYTTKVCTVCGETVVTATTRATGHTKDPETAVVTPATCTEAGYTTYTCPVCHEQFVSDNVAALGHDWQDGDILVSPTEDEFGVQELVCSRCGEKSSKSLLPTKYTYGPKVVADPESPTGYTGQFTYYDPDAETVYFCGDLMLSDITESGSSAATYSPFEYRPGLMRRGGSQFKQPMTAIGNGWWYYELPLAAGANQYWFNTNTVTRMLPDPNNHPQWSPASNWNTKDAYNAVYVPYDEKQDNELLAARVVENPRTDDKVGTWSYVEYDLPGQPGCYMGVYLPYGYDANREKPYRSIYVLHGAGQDESDWLGIGSVQNIIDNLYADGAIKEAPLLFVLRNSRVGAGNLEATFEFVEANYNVSTDRMERAICGLSMGGMMINNLLGDDKNREEPSFGYYGLFSGGQPSNALSSPHLLKSYYYVANGLYEGSIYNQSLVDSGAFCVFKQYPGAHDFNTWCQEFADFAKNYAFQPAAFGDIPEINTEALETAIADANAVDKTLYTAESVAVMEAALADAEAVLAKEDKTQDEVDAAAQALNDAIEALVVENIHAYLEQLANEAKALAEEAKAAADAAQAAADAAAQSAAEDKEAAEAAQAKAEEAQAKAEAAQKAAEDAKAAAEAADADAAAKALDAAAQATEAAKQAADAATAQAAAQAAQEKAEAAQAAAEAAQKAAEAAEAAAGADKEAAQAAKQAAEAAQQQAEAAQKAAEAAKQAADASNTAAAEAAAKAAEDAAKVAKALEDATALVAKAAQDAAAAEEARKAAEKAKEEAQAAALAAEKTNAKTMAVVAALAIDTSDFTPEQLEALEKVLEDADKAIDAAEDAEAVQKALDDAIKALDELAGPEAIFGDVQDPEKFYYDPVYWAFYADPQITNGISEDKFGPDESCTRGQVVTFLWRAAGCPEPKSAETSFKDVKKGAFYEKAVAWAVEQGITNGQTADTFAPDAKCDRGQIVTFLWRFKGSPAPKSSATAFKDLKEGAYYLDAVAWAVENEITNGMSADTFAPDSTCTRGQVVTFLYRAMAEK